MTQEKYTVQYTDENPALSRKGRVGYWFAVLVFFVVLYFIASIIYSV